MLRRLMTQPRKIAHRTYGEIEFKIWISTQFRLSRSVGMVVLMVVTCEVFFSSKFLYITRVLLCLFLTQFCVVKIIPRFVLRPYISFFFENHTVQRRRPQHARTLTPYEYTYVNPTPMSTSEGLSTGRSEDSRCHHWRLVVDGNVTYHLTCNTDK